MFIIPNTTYGRNKELQILKPDMVSLPRIHWSVVIFGTPSQRSPEGIICCKVYIVVLNNDPFNTRHIRDPLLRIFEHGTEGT